MKVHRPPSSLLPYSLFVDQNSPILLRMLYCNCTMYCTALRLPLPPPLVRQKLPHHPTCRHSRARTSSAVLSARTFNPHAVLMTSSRFDTTTTTTTTTTSGIWGVAKRRQVQVACVLEGLYDLGNVSAVLRSAEAFGIENIYLINQHSDR